MEYQTIIHPFEPVFDADCRVLILGSLPSVKSRENDFYYGHPQNRFWRVLAAVLEEPAPGTIAEKKKMLLAHHIALWDVIARCDIRGSQDASIRNAQPNDIAALAAQGQIRHILLNGQAAGRLYEKYVDLPQLPHRILPSTSPANAAWTMEKLTGIWREALKNALNQANLLSYNT